MATDLLATVGSFWAANTDLARPSRSPDAYSILPRASALGSGPGCRPDSKGTGFCAIAACDSSRADAYLVVPTASAVGSGPGCPPVGGGTGFCALRPEFDDLLHERVDESLPARTCTDCPRDAVGEAQHGFAPGRRGARRRAAAADCLTLEMMRESSRSSCRLSMTRRSTRCDCTSLDDRGQAGFAGQELGDAVPSVTDHDERAHRQLGDRCQEDPLLRIDLVVEVQATTASGQGTDGRTGRGQIASLDQHATHEVTLTTDRLVDEGIGRTEPPAHLLSPLRMSPRPAATAWSAAAKAWA